MKQRNTIAVTGATGRVGHLVAEILLTSGHRVRAVARSAERLAELEALGAEICVGSLADRHFLTQVFDGCDGAFVLSPVDTSAPDVNAEQMRNVEATAAAIADSRVKNVVL
ncbi:MAG: NAD(P)H-binding protein, partial [Microcoleus sp. C1-bin4]|nr:NAD(P)H-binding protein [Microcoleus sp. C1-bin4]